MEVDGCGKAGHQPMPQRSTSLKPRGDRNMAGICPPARRRIEARQICRLPQLQLAIPDGGVSPQVTISSRSLMLVRVVVGGIVGSKDTCRSHAWQRSQAGLPGMEVDGCGQAGHFMPRRSTSPRPTGYRNTAGSSASAERRTEDCQMCRLPQLHFPVVHAIGSPEVAPVLWLLLPSHLILGGVSTPADTYRGTAHDRSQTGLPGVEGHRLVTHRLTGEGEMAAVCIQRNKVPGLGRGVDCPNFRIPTLDARVFASQCRRSSSSASHRIFDGSRGNLDTVYGINA